MPKKIQCWIDESLESELKRIQEEMRKQLGDIDLSRPQASVIAAKQLRENPAKIDAKLLKGKGKRVRELFL